VGLNKLMGGKATRDFSAPPRRHAQHRLYGAGKREPHGLDDDHGDRGSECPARRGVRQRDVRGECACKCREGFHARARGVAVARKATRADILRENRRDDLSVNVGESAVHAGGAEGELPVVDAEKMEDRGVQIVAVGDALDGFVAEVVASAVSSSSFDSCSGEPGDK
jgi:hypothetical protein